MSKFETIAERFCYLAEKPLNKLSAKKSNKKTKKKLNPKADVRNRGDVVFPASKCADSQDHFPINSENQARNALSRCMQYSKTPSWYKGSLSSLQNAVKRKVHSKYPGIGKSEKKSKKTKKSSVELVNSMLKLGNYFEYKLSRVDNGNRSRILSKILNSVLYKAERAQNRREAIKLQRAGELLKVAVNILHKDQDQIIQAGKYTLAAYNLLKTGQEAPTAPTAAPSPTAPTAAPAATSPTAPTAAPAPAAPTAPTAAAPAAADATAKAAALAAAKAAATAAKAAAEAAAKAAEEAAEKLKQLESGAPGTAAASLEYLISKYSQHSEAPSAKVRSWKPGNTTPAKDPPTTINNVEGNNVPDDSATKSNAVGGNNVPDDSATKTPDGSPSNSATKTRDKSPSNSATKSKGKSKNDDVSDAAEDGKPGASDVRSPTSTEVRSPTSTEVRSPTSTSTEVRSPTSTSTEVRSPTSTSTEAYTADNFTATVTGGAGEGATTSVNIYPGGTGSGGGARGKAAHEDGCSHFDTVLKLLIKTLQQKKSS